MYVISPLSLLNNGELRLPVFFKRRHPAGIFAASIKGGEPPALLEPALAHIYAAFGLFLPRNLRRTRIPLSTCCSCKRNGGRKRTTVSCVLLNSTPCASPCSTMGREGMSRSMP